MHCATREYQHLAVAAEEPQPTLILTLAHAHTQGESGRRGCGIYLDHSGSPDATSVPKNMNNQPTIIAVERSQAAINAW